MIKYSKQREMIYAYLAREKNHPTAERIYNDLKPSVPALSLATVYRNLRLLCELGEVQRLETGGPVARFDADTSRHAHFICTSCHGVTDIFGGEPAELARLHRSLGEDYAIGDYRLFLYGLCPKCRRLKQ